MKTIERTAKRILIEATKNEINQKGFDNLWDEIREIYPETLYEIDSIEDTKDGKMILIKLKIRKN
jgi:hypothetical protein